MPTQIETPKDFKAELTDLRTITVSWTAPANALTYEVKGPIDLKLNYTNNTDNKATFTNPTDFKGNDKLEFTVKALENTSDYTESSEAKITYDVEPSVVAALVSSAAPPKVGGAYSGEATFVLDVDMKADNKSIDKVNIIKFIKTTKGDLNPKATGGSITGEELANLLNGVTKGGARQRQSRKSKKAGGKKRRKSQRRKQSKQ